MMRMNKAWLVLLLVFAGSAAQGQTGICNRSAHAQALLLREVRNNEGDQEILCGAVNGAMLSAITSISLVRHDQHGGDPPPSGSDSEFWLQHTEPGNRDAMNLWVDDFEGLDGLLRLKLLGFALNFYEYSYRIFSGLTALTHLDLSVNRFPNGLPSGIFRALTNLEVLNISSSRLNSLEVGTFSNLTSLRILNIGFGRRLISVPRLNLSASVNLEILTAGYMQYIDASSSGMEVPLFTDLTSLHTVTLDHSRITSVPANAFEGLTSLKHLYLNDNKISSIGADAFKDSGLIRLSLHNNEIGGIGDGAFSGLTQLEVLRLSNNRPETDLPDDFLQDADALNGLYASNAGITGALPSAMYTGKPELRYIHLGGNDITDPGVGRYDFSFSPVVDLLLEGNELTKVPMIVRKRVSRLHLHGNRLTEIPADAFTGITFLQELTLGLASGFNVRNLSVELWDHVPNVSVGIRGRSDLLVNKEDGVYLVNGLDEPRAIPPIVSLGEPSCTVNDNPCTVSESEPIMFKVVWSPPVLEPVLLSYQVSRTGAGSSGTEERALQLLPGQSQTTVHIPAVDNGFVGDSGSVTLTLLPSGAGLYILGGDASGDPERTRTVAVEDDDTLSVGVQGANPGGVTEGQPATFTFSLSAAGGGAISEDLTVHYEVTQRGDYLGASDLGAQTLTIPAGEQQASITLATVDDDVDEGNGAVVIKLLSGNYSVVNQEGAEVRVLDDDTYGVSVTAAAAQILEGEAAEFTVRLSSVAAAGGVDVRYSLTQVGDRVSSEELGEMALSFDGRVTTRTLTIPTISDSQTMPNGSLTLELLPASANSPYDLGDPVRATVNIMEDDVPNVSISGPAGSVTGEFMIEISFDQDVTDFTLEDIEVDQGSADRFSAAPGGRVYSAWITPDGSGSVTIRVERRAVAEGNNRAEPLIVRLAPVQASFEAPTVTTSGDFEVGITFTGAVSDDFILRPEDIKVEGGVVIEVRRVQASSSGAAKRSVALRQTSVTFIVVIRPIASSDGASPAIRISLQPIPEVELVQDMGDDEPTGGGGVIETSTILTVEVDTEAPTVVLSAPETAQETDGSFTVTASFSEAITGFDDPATDVVVNGGEAVEIRAVADADAAAPSYEIMVTPDASSRTVEVAVRGGAATDEAGNPNPASAASSTQVIRISRLVDLRKVGAEAVLLRHAQRFSSLTSSLVRDRLGGRLKNSWNLRADGETQEGAMDLASCSLLGKPGSCLWLNGGLSRLTLPGADGGDYSDVYGGIDYHGSRAVIGVFGGYSSSSQEISGGRYEADYQEVGVYGGVVLGGVLVDVALGYAESTPQVWRGPVAADFDAERLSFRAAMTGGVSWESGAIRVEPRVNLLYVSEDLGAFVDTAGNPAPAEELALGRLEAGPLMTVTGEHVLFRLEAPLKWVAIDDNLTGKSFSLGLNSNLDVRLSKRASLSLSADYDGIADDYRSYGFGVSLACQLKDGLSLTLAAVRGGTGTSSVMRGSGGFDDHAFTGLATGAEGRLSGFQASLNYRLAEQVTLNFLADQQNSAGSVRLQARF